MRAQGVQHVEQLSTKAEAETVKAYKIATGQLTPFSGPLDGYERSRRVEPRTAAKDRHSVERFASRVATVEGVDRKAVRDYVQWLSVEQGLKNTTISDNLGTLSVYWKWLVDTSRAPEDRPNPFVGVALPAQNKKVAAEKVRLPFSVQDIQKLDSAIEAGRSAMMAATFDHPLDHRLTPTNVIPQRYWKAIRRCTGMIGREWPEDLDAIFGGHPQNHSANPDSEHPETPKITPSQPPDTEWIFR